MNQSRRQEPKPASSLSKPHRYRSLEGLQTNVQRLKTFKAKLVVFSRRARKTKAGDSTREELAAATQVQGPVLPIVRKKAAFELVKVTQEMQSFNAYAKLRLERMNSRHLGARLKEGCRGGEGSNEIGERFLG